jgi:hypothetical protein
MVLFALPALAAPPKIVVAPAGDCAGEERELANPLLPKGVAPEDAALAPEAPVAEPDTGLAVGPEPIAHLTPANVAANLPPAGSPLQQPVPPSFAGPGACDTPGSGCVEGLFEDPDPGTGCGFPGSPCP